MNALLPIGGAALAAAALDVLKKNPVGNFLEHLIGGDREPAERKPDQQARVDMATALPSFADKVRGRLAEAGADLIEPFALKSDGRGGVVLEGEHPDRMLIEDLFDTDAQLCDEFNMLRSAAIEQTSSTQESIPGDFRLWMDRRNSMFAFE